MDIDKLEALSYEEVRYLYKNYLRELNLSKATIHTVYVDTFYLWRKANKELFWNVVNATDFEIKAKDALLRALSEHSSGNVKSLVSGYLSHLKKFRAFLTSAVINRKVVIDQENSMKITRTLNNDRRTSTALPNPTIEQVEYYLNKWNRLENYRLQEEALDKLFNELCPGNIDITDVLLKASTLNNFYSTNIFSIFPVAKHICSLDIDSRLKTGDVSLVRDIQYVTISDTQKNFYSFASKYCSHHNPNDYPIYDSYVDEVLNYFRKCDNFAHFQSGDLKDYAKFKDILMHFRTNYSLNMYNLKQIDQYLWQLGKVYFPKNYEKNKKRPKAELQLGVKRIP